MSAGARRLLAAPAALFCILIAAGARAESGPLTPEAVLAASERHYPTIVRSLAARRAAEGRALEAEGAFDIVFDIEGFSRVSGFYDGTAVSGSATQRLRSMGASVYAGYKLSDGTFPVYEDASFTNSGGTARLGVLFSLMRDRDIDEQRFELTDAALAIREAEFDLLLTRIGVQQRALVAYWRWVANGRKLLVYRDLLRIAIEREEGLEEQVESGARARIFLTENQQNITRRQTLVTLAERDLELAANALSLYYRDSDGRPTVPAADWLPPEAPPGEFDGELPERQAALSAALERRPELGLLLTAIEREQNRIALRENGLRPQLDLSLEVQEGLGGIAEGGASRDSTDTIVGLTFSVPLQQRAERGRLEQSRAELDARLAERRLREEQIELEVRDLLTELRVAREVLRLAERDVTQSEAMRASELRRFLSGASDFFIVNVREERAADAQINRLEAELSLRLALANYDAATVNLDNLGITDSNLTHDRP